jgi:hypothetical protein
VFELHRFLVICPCDVSQAGISFCRGAYLIFGAVLSMVAKAYPTVISHDLARTG